MAPKPGSSTPVRRNENLALAFQEILTAAERLRTGRQSIADAAAFRYQIMEGLRPPISRRARTATTPTTSSWPSSGGRVCGRIRAQPAQSRFCGLAPPPLAGRTFRPSRGGEVFFKNLQDLLGRPTRPILPIC